MSVIVYSTPSCSQCDATTKLLERKGIAFKKVDISGDAEVMDQLRSEGFRQFPVVMAGEQKWAGFRPDMISRIAAIAA